MNQLVEIHTEGEGEVDAGLSEKVGRFVGELSREADKRVGLRKTVELRWIEDLRQKHGQYDSDTEQKLRDNKKSKLFINQTRPKTNTVAARLSDILFPVDDRNWAIKPTPVPEIMGMSQESSNLRADAHDTLSDAKNRAVEAMLNGDAQRQEQAQQAIDASEKVMLKASEMQEEANRLSKLALTRSNMMQDEIDDQLKACQYQRACRQAIQDMCDVGIGVIKGPVTGYKPRARWKPSDDGTFALTYTDSKRPAMYRVDYWGFFPDPDLTDINDGDIYERHMMNAKQLRRMRHRKDVDKEALRRVLKEPPSRGDNPSYLVDLNDINNQKTGQTTELYSVWEFTGILEGDQIETLIEAYGSEGFEDIYLEDGTVDPLAEVSVRIWFCNNEILSFGLNPLDSGEQLYSMCTLEPDENSPFGFGIPYMMRHPQALLNAAFRMLSDNAGYGAGPQIVIDKSMVEPDNGKWEIKGTKIWKLKTSDVTPNQRPFETFDIPIHQAELANIIALAMEAIDDVTIPAIAQGEQGVNPTETAQGMAMLMNSANVVFRRWIKNFDDFMTKPNIRRMYDFNMQFSDKEELKGDYDVDVRGSSVLLVREMQSQNLLMIVDRFADHPVFKPMLKEYEAFQHLIRSNMLPVNEVVRTETEYKEELQRLRDQPSPEMQAAQMAQMEAQADREMREKEMASKERIADLEWQSRLKISESSYDATMQKIAEDKNEREDERDMQIALSEMSEGNRASAAAIAADQKDRSLAVEVAMRDKTGESAGGAV